MSMNDITTYGVPVVRWSGAGTYEPRIYIRQDLELNDHYWSIKEYGPDSNRLVEPCPSLMPEQKAQLAVEKDKLKEVWQAEEQILDTLLKLWPPTILEDVYSGDSGNRKLCYANTLDSFPLTIKVYISLEYNKAKHEYKAYATITLESLDNLDKIELPIRDGRADPAPLVKYLRDNPFKGLVKAMEQYADKLHNL